MGDGAGALSCRILLLQVPRIKLRRGFGDYCDLKEEDIDFLSGCHFVQSMVVVSSFLFFLLAEGSISN